jgi:hypothetical protein
MRLGWWMGRLSMVCNRSLFTKYGANLFQCIPSPFSSEDIRVESYTVRIEEVLFKVILEEVSDFFAEQRIHRSAAIRLVGKQRVSQLRKTIKLLSTSSPLSLHLLNRFMLKPLESSLVNIHTRSFPSCPSQIRIFILHQPSHLQESFSDMS